MKKILIVLSLVHASLTAWAGPQGSGGGNAVVCRDSMGAIVSAEFLDLYEGRLRYGLSYKSGDDLSLEARLKQAVNKLRSALTSSAISSYSTLPYWYFEDAPALGQRSVLSYLQRFDEIFRVLPESAGLPPLDDSGDVILPKKCKIERLALFKDGKVLIDGEIWNRLDTTNRAALIFHEATYKYQRDIEGATDSQEARKVVAQFFASESLKGVFDGLTNHTIYCRDVLPVGHPGYADLKGNHRKMSEFFWTRMDDGQELLQFTRLFGVQMYSKTLVRFRRDLGTQKIILGAGDILSSWKDLPPLRLEQSVGYYGGGGSVATGSDGAPVIALNFRTSGNDAWKADSFRLGEDGKTRICSPVIQSEL